MVILLPQVYLIKVFSRYMIGVMKPSKITIFYDGSCPTCTLYQSASADAGTWKKNTELNDLKRASREIVVETDDGERLGGIDAIAAIESNRGHRWRAKLLRCTLLRPFLKLGYRILAHYRRVITGPSAPAFWAKTLISGGLLAGTGLSLPLWLHLRDFPPTFLVSPIGEPFFALSPIFFSLAVAGLFWLMLARKNWTWPLLLFCVGVLGLVLGDLNRLRPWLWQLGSLLVVLGFSPRQQGLSRAFIIGLIAAYIWGGAQKMNAYFLGDVFPWFAEAWQPLATLSPEVIFTLGLATIALEIGIGVLILFPRFRLLAAGLATILHLGIITTLPLGHHWGYVIVPWNLVLLGLVWLQVRAPRHSGRPLITGIAFVLFLLLPIGNWFGVVDNYLALALYAHETDRGYITVSPKDITRLPMSAQATLADFYGEPAVDTLMWSYESFQTALYTNDKVYLAALQTLCERASDPESLVLYLRTKKRLLRTIPGQTYTCEALPNEDK